MKKFIFILSAFLSGTVLSIDITFDSAKQCSGQPLYGSKGLSDVPCYDVSQNEEILSAVLANFGEGEVVNFFSDAVCGDFIGQVLGTSCYSPKGSIGSFQVQSPSEPEMEAEERAYVQSRVMLSNYTQLQMSSPDTIDLGPYSNAIAAAAFIAVAGVTSYYGVAASCQSLTTGATVSGVIGCIQPVISFSCGAAAAHLATKSGVQFRARGNAALNQFNDLKRSTVDVNDLNFEFMAALMNTSDDSLGSRGIPVGNMIRTLGRHEQTSPMYEFDTGEDGKWHFSAFFDEENGDFIHHFHSAEETELHKRDVLFPAGDGGVKWKKGGVDIRVCPHNVGKPLSGISGVSRAQLAHVIGDQLKCQHTPAEYKKVTNVKLDLHNENLVLRAAMYVKPWANTPASPPPCGGGTVALNPDCYTG